jgi:tripartite-type tricarboxylate transporter receptor subunit TctC
MSRLLISMVPALLMLGSTAASAQDFPSKPIRITAAAPGGGSDFAARVIAQGLTDSLGRQVIVDNRPNGVLAVETAAKAPPDGYTLLVENTGFWVGPLLRKLPYEPFKDFLPVTMTDRQPLILVVHPSMPLRTVKDVITLAKSRPGELNYGSSGIGTSLHLAGEQFKSLAGVNIVHVPYKATAQGLAEIMAGQVHVMFPLAAGASPHTRSGRLRPLAVTSPEPSSLLPELPTVAASGLPGFELVSLQGVFVPAGTPAAIVTRLNQELVRALGNAEVKGRFLKAGSEVVGSSPDQFTAAIKGDMVRLGRVIKEAGITVD